MDEFTKDRRIEKETYAIINYFKLLRQAEVAEMETYNNKYFPEDTFTLIGGKESFARLLIDYEAGNIDIISESISSLFQKLEENIGYINSVSFSKGSFSNQAINEFELIKKFYSDVYSINGNQNVSALYDLATLPLPKDMISQIMELKPKTKKIGER